MIQSLLRMKQMAGVEPVYSAWEADILPMNYICERCHCLATFVIVTYHFYLVNTGFYIKISCSI